MSANKNIDRICALITALTLIITLIFCSGEKLGIEIKASAMGYEERLFDNTKVHTIDIVMNDWDGFVSTCESEEYSPCNVVIDGEAVKNVGIRGKGNTSLSSVKSMDSSRYSFKIEFDQYEDGKTYYGLDKLCLNNIIQDNTYMKDYLAYTLMKDFGVDAPLCSYAYITVNGEDWGLYLAVEAVEDSFLERNYGGSVGELYKPDAMSFGGGRGNGKNFDMSGFMKENGDESGDGEKSSDGKNGGMPNFGDMGDFDPSQFGGGMPDMGDFDPSQFGGGMPDMGNFDPSQFEGKMPDMGGGFGGFGGMGSDDVKLKYSDDEIDSYSNIFNNAKTDVSKADKKRLIRSLKALSEKSDLESAVDVEEVIRYFVVHTFLCNGDSYTGQMIHNYYLYEEDGQLSMIPWDYNLAYGSFQGGDASSSVNSPIDTPVSGDMSDRPMIAWIFDSDEYTELYHRYYSEFISSVDLGAMVSETAAMIDKYVEKDPTKFCTYEEFKTGVEAIREFCTLRAESVKGQLDGTIPSTTDGQKADSGSLIDTGDLDTSDMGSMGGKGGGFGGFGGFGGKSESNEDADAEKSDGESDGGRKNFKMTKRMAGSAVSVSAVELSDKKRPDKGDMPSDFDPSKFGNGEMPGDFDPSKFGDGEMPGDFDPSKFGDGEMPDDFDPSKFGKSEKSDDKDEDVSEVTTDQTDAQKPDKAGMDKGNAGGRERPSMGGFSDMGGTEQKRSAVPLILLGVSALVLIAGLVFAAKFKR